MYSEFTTSISNFADSPLTFDSNDSTILDVPTADPESPKAANKSVPDDGTAISILDVDPLVCEVSVYVELASSGLPAVSVNPVKCELTAVITSSDVVAEIEPIETSCFSPPSTEYAT